MRYALASDPPVEVPPGTAFANAAGDQYPANWLTPARTAADIAAAGLVAIVEPPAAPTGQQILPGPLVRIGDDVHRSYTLVEMPVPSLDARRADLVAMVNAERDRRIEGGFVFQGARYQTRAADRENIAGKAQIAFMAVIAGARAGDLLWDETTLDPATGERAPFRWIAEDNSLVPMDAPTTVAFGKAAAGFKQACIFRAFVLKAAIGAADIAALDTFDISTGWPGIP